MNVSKRLRTAQRNTSTAHSEYGVYELCLHSVCCLLGCVYETIRMPDPQDLCYYRVLEDIQLSSSIRLTTMNTETTYTASVKYANTSTMSTTTAFEIAPSEMATDLPNHIVTKGLSKCACGFYDYYSAVCGHLYQSMPYRCGGTATSSHPRFCRLPTPRHDVHGTKINEKCTLC